MWDLLFLPFPRFLTVLLDMLDIKRPHHMVVGTGLVGVPGGGREGLGAVSSSCCFFFPPAVYPLLLLPHDCGRKEPLFHFTHRLRTVAAMELHLCAAFVYLRSAVADDVQNACRPLLCKPWRTVIENSHLLSVSGRRSCPLCRTLCCCLCHLFSSLSCRGLHTNYVAKTFPPRFTVPSRPRRSHRLPPPSPSQRWSDLFF